MSDSNNPNYIVTILLACTPIGWIGLHHAYLGNKKRAIFYFLTIWTLIPIILTLIDLGLLLHRGEERFIEKYHNDKSKQEYYAEKLAETNPDAFENMVNQQENQEPNENQEESDVDEDDGVDVNEPDYSDYYGKWN